MTIPDNFTINGLKKGDVLKVAATERTKKCESFVASPDLVEDRLNKGWSVNTKLKTGTKMIKEKSLGTLFENQVWMIFYKMGFQEMNEKSPGFIIPRFDSGINKQIDVFARNENTICLIECKATEEPHTLSSTKKEIRDAINEISAMQRDRLETSIFRHYTNTNGGKHENYKVLWFLALKNIDLSSQDQELAKQANIIVMDNSLIEYYEQLAKHFGNTSKYMFLGGYLPNKTIPGSNEPVPAIRSTMGKKVFYSFVIEPERLLRISYLSHRGKTDAPSIDTYQRIAKKKRLDTIANYIKEGAANGNLGGNFPSSIIINLESSNIRFEIFPDQKGQNSQCGNLYLPNEYNSAWIIDGQHRLYAYSNLAEASTASLPVIAFQNLPPNEQAKIFVDINGKQEKVDNNLLLEIKANILRKSVKGDDQLEAIYAQTTLELNSDRNSLFYDRIIEANRPKNHIKNITKNTIFDEFKKTKLIGSSDHKNPGEIKQGYLYKDRFEETCHYVKDVLCDYYSLYLKNPRVKEQWDLGNNDGGFLCTNHGIKSTIRLLNYILLYIDEKHLTNHEINIRDMDQQTLMKEVGVYLQPVIEFLANTPQSELSQMRKSTGESGIKMTNEHLVTIINDKYPDFHSSIANTYRELHSADNRARNERGAEIGGSLECIIRNNIVQALKEKYGIEINQWFGEGVSPKIRGQILKVTNENGDFTPNYADYLCDFEFLKDMIYSNWDIFDKIYTIDAKASEGKKKRVAWLERCSDLKKLYSCPDGEIISQADLDFLETTSDTVSGRLESI